MRQSQFRLRAFMLNIAFLCLFLTITVQAIWLRSAALREQHLRVRLARAEPEAAWVEAIDEWDRFLSSPQNQQRWAAAMNYELHRMSTQNATR